MPRRQFLCDLASKGELAQAGLAHVLRRNVLQSDQNFARRFNKPEVMLVYDDAYKQACWDRYISEHWYTFYNWFCSNALKPYVASLKF